MNQAHFAVHLLNAGKMKKGPLIAGA